MAKTHTLKHAAFGTMLDASQPLIWTQKAVANAVAGTNDIVAGDFVYRTGGYVTVAAVDTDPVFGLALEPSGDAIKDIQVLVFTEMLGIAMTVMADNAETAHTLVQLNLGVEYDVAFDAAHMWYIDVANTATSIKVRIQKFINPVDDINARVIATLPNGWREVS